VTSFACHLVGAVLAAAEALDVEEATSCMVVMKHPHITTLSAVDATLAAACPCSC
jgi:hypothetical protein